MADVSYNLQVTGYKSYKVTPLNELNRLNGLNKDSFGAAAFYVELGKGAREGGVGGGDFLVREFVAKTGLGTSTGFFDFGFVDVIGSNGHVRKDVYVVGSNFDEAFADRKGMLVDVFADNDFAGDHLGQERYVLGVDAELAFNPRESDHVGVFRENGAVGRDDFKLHSLISAIAPFM